MELIEPIKEKSLSVGYCNKLGQEFFDLLHRYKRYIHSYFFSITETQKERIDINGTRCY